MYCVFDVETTGISPDKNQIIEIGAVIINEQGEILDKFQTFVDLYKVMLIPDNITALTGITMHDTIGADDIEDAINKFLILCEQHNVQYFVAQNAKFDMKFLYYAVEELGMNNKLETILKNIGVIDTMVLAKLIHKNNLALFENYKLGSIAATMGISYDADAHHRADYDAELTAKVFIKMVSVLGDKFKIASLEKNPYIYSTIKKQNEIIDIHQQVIDEIKGD